MIHEATADGRFQSAKVRLAFDGLVQVIPEMAKRIETLIRETQD